ncbi:MAG: MmcQ/YjbR family DNA-binding protein [Pseudomonadota bacterium]
MTWDEYNAYCASLTATTFVEQWGGSQVWKVGGKVFAVASTADGRPAYTFKTSWESFEILCELPGVRPAPYLASRGMSWVQHYAEPGLSDDDLRHYLSCSHRRVAGGLAKKTQRALGLLAEDG